MSSTSEYQFVEISTVHAIQLRLENLTAFYYYVIVYFIYVFYFLIYLAII